MNEKMEKHETASTKVEQFEVKSSDLMFSEPRDFRGWEDQIKGTFGKETYVGTDACVVLLEYSPEMSQLIRPLNKNKSVTVNIKLVDEITSERTKAGKWVVKSTKRKVVIC